MTSEPQLQQQPQQPQDSFEITDEYANFVVGHSVYKIVNRQERKGELTVTIKNVRNIHHAIAVLGELRDHWITEKYKAGEVIGEI